MGDDRPTRYVESDGRIIYRASGLGGCMKALAALGLGHRPEPHPDWLLRKFEIGNRGEPVVLAKLKDTFDPDINTNGGAWVCVDERSGHQYKWDHGQLLVEIHVGSNIVIRGHADGLGQLWAKTIGSPFASGEKRLVEVKCTSEEYGKLTMSKLAIQNPALTAAITSMYAYQVSTYAHYFGLKVLLVIGVVDENGDVVRIMVQGLDQPPYSIGKVKARVIEIEKRINSGDMGRCDVKNWPCQFSWLCDDVAGVEGTTDEQLEEQLEASLVKIRERVRNHGE